MLGFRASLVFTESAGEHVAREEGLQTPLD